MIATFQFISRLREKLYTTYSFLFSPRCNNTSNVTEVKLRASFIEMFSDILLFCLKSIFSTWLSAKPVTQPPTTTIISQELFPLDTDTPPKTRTDSETESESELVSENAAELAVIPNRGYFNRFRVRPSPMLEIDGLADETETVSVHSNLLIDSVGSSTTVEDYSDSDSEVPNMEAAGQLPDVHNLPRNFVMPIYSASGEDTSMVMIGRGRNLRPLMPQGIFFSDDPEEVTKKIGYSDDNAPRWSQKQLSYDDGEEDYNSKIKELGLLSLYPQAAQPGSVLALTNNNISTNKEDLPLVSFDSHFSRLQNNRVTSQPIKAFMRTQEEEESLHDAKALLDMRSHCVTLLARYSLSFTNNKEFILKNPELTSVYIEKQCNLIELRFHRQILDIRTLFPIFHPRYHVLLTFIKDLRTIEYLNLNRTLKPSFPFSAAPSINLMLNLNFSRVPEVAKLNTLFLFQLNNDELEIFFHKFFKDKK